MTPGPRLLRRNDSRAFSAKVGSGPQKPCGCRHLLQQEEHSCRDSRANGAARYVNVVDRISRRRDGAELEAVRRGPAANLLANIASRDRDEVASGGRSDGNESRVIRDKASRRPRSGRGNEYLIVAWDFCGYFSLLLRMERAGRGHGWGGSRVVFQRFCVLG